jgi:hypothetical protein
LEHERAAGQDGRVAVVLEDVHETVDVDDADEVVVAGFFVPAVQVRCPRDGDRVGPAGPGDGGRVDGVTERRHGEQPGEQDEGGGGEEAAGHPWFTSVSWSQ